MSDLHHLRIRALHLLSIELCSLVSLLSELAIYLAFRVDGLRFLFR